MTLTLGPCSRLVVAAGALELVTSSLCLQLRANFAGSGD
jgi:hypothetical protein